MTPLKPKNDFDTTEIDFRDFRSDYLGEYEAICETVLARESGP
jgi:hypothetical protein